MAQLRTLNPLLALPLRGLQALAPTQAVLQKYKVEGKAAAGVSCFGYSGTIAHAVLAFGSGGDREAIAFGRDPDASEALAFGTRGAEAAYG